MYSTVYLFCVQDNAAVLAAHEKHQQPDDSMTSPTSGWQDESVQQQQMLQILAAYHSTQPHNGDTTEPVVMRNRDKPPAQRPEVIDTRTDPPTARHVPKPQSYVPSNAPPSRDSERSLDPRTRSLDSRPRAHSDNHAVQEMFAKQNPVRQYESMREPPTQVSANKDSTTLCRRYHQMWYIHVYVS